MQNRFGTNPGNLVVQLSPCIRPPAYEIDFAALIRAQALEAGVQPKNLHDSSLCTSADPDRFYSYRRERGRTGRMLALMGRIV
jgi:polyphenol oxidase